MFVKSEIVEHVERGVLEELAEDLRQKQDEARTRRWQQQESLARQKEELLNEIIMKFVINLNEPIIKLSKFPSHTNVHRSDIKM